MIGGVEARRLVRSGGEFLKRFRAYFIGEDYQGAWNPRGVLHINRKLMTSSTGLIYSRNSTTEIKITIVRRQKQPNSLFGAFYCVWILRLLPYKESSPLIGQFLQVRRGVIRL